MRLSTPIFLTALILAFIPATWAGPLRIYTSCDAELGQRVVDDFKKKTGQEVEFVRLSTGEALTRLRTESKRPQASAWFCGPTVEYAVAASENLFEAYRPKLSYELPVEAHDSQWRWTGIYYGAIAFGTNQSLLKKAGVSAPTTWQDLLRPEFKGKIAFALPYTSGTAMMILLGVVQQMGEEAGLAYFKKLDAQVHQYTKSGAACVNQVGLGEIQVCVAFAQDLISKGIKKGYPIQLTFPKEGTGYETGGVALVRGGPEQERSKRFIDWVHSADGQRHFEAWHQTPSNPAVAVKPPTVRVQDLKLVQLDSDWVLKNQKRLVEEWRTVTGK